MTGQTIDDDAWMAHMESALAVLLENGTSESAEAFLQRLRERLSEQGVSLPTDYLVSTLEMIAAFLGNSFKSQRRASSDMHYNRRMLLQNANSSSRSNV